jgi:phage FluMu protein Com
LGNLREKLIRFMYGRYGADQLYYALFAVYFILLLINAFVRSPFLVMLEWGALAWMMFRALSRNISKRQKENALFLKFWKPIQTECLLLFRRFREIKTYRFRKCPQCNTVLRLKRKTGKLMVKCPRCQNRFQAKIYF